MGDQLRSNALLLPPAAKPNIKTHKAESQHFGPHLKGFLSFSNSQPLLFYKPWETQSK